MTDRPALLADLTAAVDALTRGYQVTEYVEVANVQAETNRRGKRRKSKGAVRVRRAHHTWMPALLDQLRTAEPPTVVPANAGGGYSKGGFESRPPSELATLSVLREIVDGTRAWAVTMRIPTDVRGTEDILRALVDLAESSDLLGQLTEQTERWVTAAKAALGLEAPAVTLMGDSCPNCWRQNCLVVAGDMSSAHCSRCGRTWSADMIGLLSIMLEENRGKATAASSGVPCWMRDCVVPGQHQVHRDDRGRTWGDSCNVGTNVLVTP